MSKNIRKLIFKFFLSRIAILILINLILVSLLFAELHPFAIQSVTILLGLLNCGSITAFFLIYNRIKKSLLLPAISAYVKLWDKSLSSTEVPLSWQTALVGLENNKLTDLNQFDLKLEVGVSSAAIPNMMDVFSAKIFQDKSKPVLILNEEKGILATVTDVLIDNRS